MMWIFFEDENGKRDKVERDIYIYWSDAKKSAIKVLDVKEDPEDFEEDDEDDEPDLFQQMGLESESMGAVLGRMLNIRRR